jgi:N6-adenosine-specific RNA methylase IME4
VSKVLSKDHPFAGLRRNYYRCLYVDPPWQFRTWSRRGEGKSASQHYECMSLQALMRLPVRDLVMPDAVLFLWVVQPMLPEALDVIRAWGFVFKTVAFCWVKTDMEGRPRMGLGYHTRSGMEQCWLATRGGGYKRQAQGVKQVLHDSLREHSRKPDAIAARIERLVGDVPRIELFARGSRRGWHVWGRQA